MGDLFDVIDKVSDTKQAMNFDGDTFNKELDAPRLTTQFGRVKALMLDGKWRTLSEIQDVVGGTEASVSARLRDLRKVKFGEYVVDRQRRGEPSDGFFEYKLGERI